MKNDPLFDSFGNKIEAGDRIVYAALDGRSGVLRRGKVVEAYWRDTSYEWDSTPNYQPRILIEAERYSVNYRDRTGTWRPMSKRVTLTFPDRVMVVDKADW